MFPFTSCVSILRHREQPTDWKQVNGTMTFLMESNKECRESTFQSGDKNAIYIHMLGDVHLPDSSRKMATGQPSQISEADRTMLDKLVLPDERLKFRSRFMSVSKGRRQRKSLNKRRLEVRLSVDETYESPTRLLLLRIGDWDFNIFSLERLSAGRSLFHIAFHLFETYDFIRGFQLDSVRLVHFLSLVEENYHESNPYHNALHAADITQSMHSFLQEKEIKESTSDLEKLTSIIAALTHDIDHPGVNNTFLIVTSNHLAILYQNTSVLENHHWRSAVGILQETGLLSHLSTQERERVIHLLKELILATDITRQQEFLLKFSRYIESGEFQYRRNEEHRHFLLQIALKCADISNPCRPWKISQQWSLKVCQEFFLQGDTERTLNVAVTPLCDRHGNTIANIQHGFMQFVVTPLFKAWDKFLGTELSAEIMFHLYQNQSKWKLIMDSGKDVSEVDSDIWEGQFDDDKTENMAKPQKKDVMNNNQGSESSSPLAADVDVSQKIVNNEEHIIHLEQEEEEGKSEEDDVVENDVNLLYHYQPDSEESGRCLSPVSEDSENSTVSTSSIRRYSAPYVIRKDLSFYLGLRKDLNLLPNQTYRRQSLPTTVMFFHGSSSSSSVSCNSPRSLSVDALLTRPKISNLSTSMEMGFMGSGFDSHSFTPLKNQILMLQGGSLTRYISNTNLRRSSLEPVSHDRPRLAARYNLNSDLVIPPFKNVMHSLQQPSSGLASSWPTVNRRSTTNGSIHRSAASSAFSTESVSNKLNSNCPSDDHIHSGQISPHLQLNIEESSKSDTSTK